MDLYFDLDNTLADFSIVRNLEDSLNRFRDEIGFFSQLEQTCQTIQYSLKELMFRGHDLYVLTHSPNKQADNDKRIWCQEFLPFIPQEHIICQRLGSSKANILQVRDVLIDDRVKNLREIEEIGGIGVKAQLGNSNCKKWKGLTVKQTFHELLEIF